jgi:hypothetical protein
MVFLMVAHRRLNIKRLVYPFIDSSQEKMLTFYLRVGLNKKYIGNFFNILKDSYPKKVVKWIIGFFLHKILST